MHWENAERKLMELQVMQYQDSKVKQRIKRTFAFITIVALSEFKCFEKDDSFLETFYMEPELIQFFVFCESV